MDAIQTMIAKMQLQTKVTFIQVQGSAIDQVHFGLAEGSRQIQDVSHGIVIPLTKLP
jgi:ATP-dependent 26S proteasome regulatory subunit